MTKRQAVIAKAKEAWNFLMTNALSNDKLKLDQDGYAWYQEDGYLVILKPNGSIFQATKDDDMRAFMVFNPA